MKRKSLFFFFFSSFPVRPSVHSSVTHMPCGWFHAAPRPRPTETAVGRGRGRRCIGVGDASGMLNTDFAQSEFAKYSDWTDETLYFV